DRLLRFLFFFGSCRFGWALGLSLGVRLFHGFLGFGSSLRSSLSTLLALLFLQFFAAQKFDKRLVGTVTFLPTGADDSQETAVAIPETRRNRVKQFANGFTRHQVRSGLTAGSQVSALAQCDHLFHVRTQGFGFGQSGFNALFDNERRDQVTQQ